jgi:hypothetical protein
MNKTLNIEKELEKAHYQAIILSEALTAMDCSGFTRTFKGACTQYDADERVGAFLWMEKHYQSLAAAVKSSSLIADILKDKLEKIYDA